MPSSQRSTVLVAGSANLDFVVRADRIPLPGETVLGHDFRTFPGGKGANQAVACARAGGVATRMLLALGDDAFAAPIEDSLRSAGVTLQIVRVSQPTGTAFICVSSDAQNAITVAPGANSALGVDHLPTLDGVTCLLMQLETPIESVAAYARAARSAGVKVALNAAPARALPRALLDEVDILIVNEGELAAISGIDGDIAAALATLPVPTVIVTLGARGACLREQGRFHLQPGFAVDAVDTTAAGDTFCGVFVAALTRGRDAAAALREACAAAALACTRAGAQTSIPTAAEVAALEQSAATQPDDAVAALARHCGIAQG
ncbi:MAG: ribokinase [Rudaea sp.]